MVLSFICGNTGVNQLYVGHHVYHRHRANYWKCVRKDCNVTIGTTGETSNDEIRIPKYFTDAHKGESQDKLLKGYLNYIQQRHGHDIKTPVDVECLKVLQAMKIKV